MIDSARRRKLVGRLLAAAVAMVVSDRVGAAWDREPPEFRHIDIVGRRPWFAAGDLEARIGWVPALSDRDELLTVDLDDYEPLDPASLDLARSHVARLRRDRRAGSDAVDERRIVIRARDPETLATAWVSWRVLDEGVSWEQALREARTIGLPPWTEADRLVHDYVLGPQPERWPVIKGQVRARFPAVHQMSVAALAARMGMKRRPPLLLDVRATEEFATSHLSGARHAPDLHAALAALEGLPKHTDIVTYCSVGWRSSDLAQRLTSRGYTRVRNLEGSMFEWANRGHAVVRDGVSVEEVHPFDPDWGQLLRRRLWPEGFGE